MNKIFLIGLLSFSLNVFAQKKPEINKTKFTETALAQKVISQDGKKISVKDILKKHEGKIVIIDFWASWCRDCILALPKTQKLMEDHQEIDFVYFSVDRSMEQWKRGLDKYDISAKENYWFDEGWKNSFNDFVELNWVPRFIVVDQRGDIANYYAISPDDPEMQTTIAKLTQK